MDFNCRIVSTGFYKDDLSLPLIGTRKTLMTKTHTVKTLLYPHAAERVCQKIPTNISNNTAFLLDASILKTWEDWKSDDMGSWRNNGVKRSLFINHKGKIKLLTGKMKKSNPQTSYTLVRYYYKNRTSNDLKKVVSYLQGRWKYRLLDTIIQSLLRLRSLCMAEGGR